VYRLLICVLIIDSGIDNNNYSDFSQTLYQPSHTPSSILPRLQRLHDNGKYTINAIVMKLKGDRRHHLKPLTSSSDRVSNVAGSRGAWIGNTKAVLPAIRKSPQNTTRTYSQVAKAGFWA